MRWIVVRSHPHGTCNGKIVDGRGQTELSVRQVVTATRESRQNRCFFGAALLLQMENVRNVLKGFNGYGESVQHAAEEIVTHRYFDMPSVTANARSLTKQHFGLFCGVRST